MADPPCTVVVVGVVVVVVDVDVGRVQVAPYPYSLLVAQLMVEQTLGNYPVRVLPRPKHSPSKARYYYSAIAEVGTSLVAAVRSHLPLSPSRRWVWWEGSKAIAPGFLVNSATGRRCFAWCGYWKISCLFP